MVTTSPLHRVIEHLRADLAVDGDEVTDAELLSRFVRSRDEDALATLVRRHAPMVWGVCRRLLNHHDADDAFQATFLVLVRKAAGVPRQAVSNWLYGVARQTAVRLRATAAKQGRREAQVVNMPEPIATEVRDVDLSAVLDEELSHLPAHYRGVIVLCELEGMTRKEAARQLGIPEGSVASRLARARALLAKRLTQRGIVFSGGSVAAVLSAGAAASAPPALVASTIKVASLLAAGLAGPGVIPVKVAALTEGVVKAMFVTKMKSAVAVGLMVVALCWAGAVCVTQAADPPKGGQAAERAANADQPVKEDPKEAKTDELRLRGNWNAVEVVEGGEKSKAGDDHPIMSFTFAGKNSSFTIKDERIGGTGVTLKCSFVCRLDAFAEPKTIDIACWKPGFEDKAQFCEGIYTLDGDTLTICFQNDALTAEGTSRRPTGFDTATAPGTQVLIFKRVK